MAAKQAPAFEIGKRYNLPSGGIKPAPDQPYKYAHLQVQAAPAASIVRISGKEPGGGA